MNRLVFIYLFALMLCSKGIIAQDSISKQEIPIVDIKEEVLTEQLKDQKTQKKMALPQADLAGDLIKPISEWIQYQSNAYIRTNGINSTSTLSVRGASAAQTGLFWNDLPIRNTQSGMSDLNAYPNFFFENAWILYEGQGSKLGAGSMGGALALYNQEELGEKDSQLRVNTLLHWNSLNNLDFGQKVGFKTDKGIHHIKWLHSQYQQQFDFIKRDEVLPMMHSHASKNAFMTNHQWHWEKAFKHSFAINSWLHQNQQEIPSTLFETQSEKYLSTDFVKLQAIYKQQRLNQTFKSALMISSDHYEYKDWAINLSSPFDYGHIVWQNEWLHYNHFQWGRNANHWMLTSQTKLPIEYSWIKLKPSNKIEEFQLASFFLSQHFTLENKQQGWSFEAGLGIDFDTQEKLNFLPSLSTRKDFNTIDWRDMNTNFYIGSNLQRGFRKPTLIDWYLFPGGNIDLKPEIGWGASAHTGVDIIAEKSQTEYWKWSSQVGYYQRKVDNWIYWLGGTIWTPYNIASVHNRGLETEHQFTWRNHSWRLNLRGTTAYNLATTLASHIVDEDDLGKQIPYTPRYQFNFHTSLKYKDYELSWFGNYIGYRFTTLDESSYMEPYFLQHVAVKTRIQWRKWNIYPEFKMANLANVRYEVIAYRPMPQRFFELGLNVDLYQ